MAILTQQEAEELISELKRKVHDNEYEFPLNPGRFEFDVIADSSNEYTINIQRKGIKADSCTYQGRLSDTNRILMRLDVDPTAKHMDRATGETIVGPHLHIYSEENDMKNAIPFNVENKDLYEICFDFFERFNIIDPPNVNYPGQYNGQLKLE